jgi:phage protein U
VLNIHNLRETNQWNWYGEGDDMIFIDGEQWPPSLHGTGTEDYFNTA